MNGQFTAGHVPLCWCFTQCQPIDSDWQQLIGISGLQKKVGQLGSDSQEFHLSRTPAVLLCLPRGDWQPHVMVPWHQKEELYPFSGRMKNSGSARSLTSFDLEPVSVLMTEHIPTFSFWALVEENRNRKRIYTHLVRGCFCWLLVNLLLCSWFVLGTHCHGPYLCRLLGHNCQCLDLFSTTRTWATTRIAAEMPLETAPHTGKWILQKKPTKKHEFCSEYKKHSPGFGGPNLRFCKMEQGGNFNVIMTPQWSAENILEKKALRRQICEKLSCLWILILKQCSVKFFQTNLVFLLTPRLKTRVVIPPPDERSSFSSLKLHARMQENPLLRKRYLRSSSHRTQKQICKHFCFQILWCILCEHSN